MKIAMVSEHASPLACLGGVDAGGQNVHVAALSVALAARGHDVTVYTRADQPGLPRAVQFAPGVVVEHVLAGPATELPKDELLPYMGRFGEVLADRWEKQRPDIVHAHFWMSGLASLQAAPTADVPVVQTFHALGTVKRRWQKSADGSPPERIRLERQIIGSADCIIATCVDEVRELRRMGGRTAHIDVVPCGVDIAMFKPGARQTHRPHRLVMIGRLVPRKGVQDAIRALGDIPDAELVIVGGPAADGLPLDPEARRLAELVHCLGLSDRVKFTGRCAHADLPAVINSADIVLAVPWYEPFGIVPLEAMACGVPVVGTAVGGLLDTVVEGVTGVLVRPGQPLEIADAVNRLLGDAALRDEMGKAGRSRAEMLYSWDSVARRTEESYRRTLAARQACADAHAGIATAGAGR
jgi:D-inositol-3-phosphate glycosyltransferase